MSEVFEKTVAELKLDRSDWQLVKFGDVAIQQKQTVDRENTKLTRYVKGEHMYSEDIHLREWGELKDEYLGPAFIRKFEEGDILYGSRRTYLRKVVIAPFEGITSNTTFVIKANEEKIDKRLLPFIMLSEGFSQHSIKNSKGSVNPYVNWKDLAGYEFLLPPIFKQEEVVELLTSLDASLEQDKKTLNKLDITLNSYIKQVINSHITETKTKLFEARSPFQTHREEREYPKNWQYVPLKSVISNVQNGFAEGKRDDTGIPQLRMNNVTRDSRIDLTKVAMIPERANLERYSIQLDDVMFCNTNSEDLVGKSIIADKTLQDFTFSNHFTRIRPNKDILTPKFLYIWMKYHFDIGVFESRCTKWIGQAAVQTESLLRLYIAIPPVDEQKKACQLITELERNIDNLKRTINTYKLLEKSITNRIF